VAELVAVPPVVVTETVPLVAPVGTLTVTVVAVVAVGVAEVPLNLTAVAPVRLVPVIVTAVPTMPEVGVKLVIVGAATTVKLVADVAVPTGVVTAIVPVVAPVGTFARMRVAELDVIVAAMPLNLTDVAGERLEPEIVTTVPTLPEVGERLAIAGGSETLKEVVLVAIPPEVVTDTRPLFAPVGTLTVTEVAVVAVGVAVELNGGCAGEVRAGERDRRADWP
jgi:hypothetical protein